MSQITTHILDTMKGKPAKGINALLYQQENNELPAAREPGWAGETGWREIAIGTTNKDGRIADFLNKETVLEPGIYKIRFETQEYFDKQSIQSFYPFVEIVFTISAKEHYHLPLLLSPFGYSTYRGS